MIAEPRGHPNTSDDSDQIELTSPLDGRAMSHEVFLILDHEFSGDVWALSRSAHVWLIKSPQNDAAARVVWDSESKSDAPLQRVTTFDGAQDANDSFYNLLSTIDRHHNEYSAPEPWSAIHVIGLPLDKASADRIAAELGVEVLLHKSEGDGFTIRRAAASQ